MLTVRPWQGNMSFVRTALEPLVNAWLDTHASDRTRSAYARDVAAYLAWCLPAGRDPLDSQVVDLDAYREVSPADGASSSTVAR